MIGYSCTGKTTLAPELAKMLPDHKLIHTDEYQGAASYGEAPRYILNEIIAGDNENIIVEGVHAYRLLRAAAESRTLFFDVVIHCQTIPSVRYARYEQQRNPEMLHRQPGIEKSLNKIFNEYIGLCNGLGRTPKIIDYWS